MQKALSESADIRKLAISLKAVEYGGELTTELLNASKALEAIYEHYITLQSKKVPDAAPYNKLLEQTNQKLKWIEKGKAF